MRLFDEPHQRAAVRVEVGKRNSCWLYGAGLPRLLDKLGVPRGRDWHPDRRGVLMAPTNRIADVIAWLEHNKRVVEVVAVER